MKKWKLDRIISVTTLLASLTAVSIAIYLAVKRPPPVAPPQTVAAAAANAQSFQEKLQQLDLPKDSTIPPAEVRITAQEVGGALAAAAGAIPSASAQLSPNTDLGSMPQILDQQVSFDGDQVHGQFLTTIAGKQVWVTVSGRLGSKDGYATFEPTEFKIGDMVIPVSLVNGALQKQLAEQRDKLKLPENVGGVKVEDGQLVLTQK
jgi:hypothetical protein